MAARQTVQKTRPGSQLFTIGRPPSGACRRLPNRASFELAQKVAMAGADFKELSDATGFDRYRAHGRKHVRACSSCRP